MRTAAKRPKKVTKGTDRNIPLELINELYRSYDFFNEYYCEGKLPRPMIIISSNFNKKAHGWFGPGSWKVSGKEISEITLCGESFIHGTDQVFDTLLHEMAHLKNYYENECKVVDCTEQQRHNKIFKATAEFFGLIVTSSQRFGYGHTDLGDEAHKAIEELKPNYALYEVYRNMKMKEDKKKKEQKLKPVMIDKETKELIAGAAESLGISQKELTTNAVNLYVGLADRMKTMAYELFENRKKYKSAGEIEAYLSDALSAPEKVIEDSKS